MKKFAIIVAGGQGTRMSSTTPKQFITIAGKPILVHTIEAFRKADNTIELILVLPSAHLETWFRIGLEYCLNEEIKVVVGGASRFQSVSNGLEAIPYTQGYVAVHDAVRPCIEPSIINAAYHTAMEYESGIVCVKLKDSIRENLPNGASESRDRDNYYLVQTPQVFDLAMLKNAYKQLERSIFTDDASVFEGAGHQIKIVEGDYKNIKVTTDEDLILVEAMLKNKKP